MKKFFTFFLFIFSSMSSIAQTDLVVDPNARYQTFKGFGVSLSWWANVIGGWDNAAIHDICTSLTSSNELNMNYFRFNIGGGDNPGHAHMRADAQMPGYKTSRTGHYDWTADARQRKILKKIHALKSSAIYEAVSYSPPYWMTVSGCSAGEANGGENLPYADYTTFADYLTEVVKHYKDSEGITFSTLTPMNEPYGNWWKANGSQEGCHFPQKKQDMLINAVYDKLYYKNMVSYCGVSVVDANTIDEAYHGLNGYVSSGIISRVKCITTHSYGGTQRAELYNAATAQGKEVWQTESGPLGINVGGIDNYLVMANRIIDDLKKMKAVVWADWQAMSYDDYWGLIRYNATNQTYVKLKSYYVRKQFSKYLKPGYTIVNSSENTIAALNAANNELVIVVVNRDISNSVSHRAQLNLFASAGPSAAVYRTSPTEDCVQLSSIDLTNNMFSYTAPARSVTTFVIPVTLAAGPPFYSGNFRITAKHSNKDLSVEGWSGNNGGIIEQWTPLGQGNEVFNVQWTPSGYKFLPSYNAKAITVNGYSTANGAVVDQYSDLEQANQRFSIIDVGGGYYKIVARHSGKCLAIARNGLHDGADVVQSEWVNQDNFKWQFTEVPLKATIPNGTYTIRAKHSNKVMSVAGVSSGNGAIIEQWDNLCQSNEKFTIEFTPEGYIIRPSYNGKVISVSNRSVSNGAAMIQLDDYNQSHQRYEIVSLGSGYYKIVSRNTNQCLAVDRIATNNSADVVLWEWLNYDNFRWAFESPCGAMRTRTAPPQPTDSTSNLPSLKIYPNPSSDYVTVQHSGINDPQIYIHDINGKLLITMKGADSPRMIDISKFPKGVYILKISGTNKTILEKTIVKF